MEAAFERGVNKSEYITKIVPGFDPLTGDQEWLQRFDSGDNQVEEARAMTVSPQGDLYVVGYGYRFLTGTDVLALNYRTGVASSAAASPAAPRLFLAARPNPAAYEVSFTYELARDERARLSLYDASGRRLVVLRDGMHASGEHRVSWDGHDAGGRKLPSGIYLYRLDVGEESQTRKLVLAR